MILKILLKTGLMKSRLSKMLGRILTDKLGGDIVVNIETLDIEQANEGDGYHYSLTVNGVVSQDTVLNILNMCK